MSPHITLRHPKSPSLAMHHPASPYLYMHHPASPCLTLHQPASPCLSMHHPASPCMTPNHPCITLHHPASPCITLSLHASSCHPLNLKSTWFDSFCQSFCYQTLVSESRRCKVCPSVCTLSDETHLEHFHFSFPSALDVYLLNVNSSLHPSRKSHTIWQSVVFLPPGRIAQTLP